MSSATPPLVMHVVHRLDFGGLENGLVNLINRMEPSRYRHAVVCLTGYTDFAKRIQRPAVPLIALNKQPGKDPACSGVSAAPFAASSPMWCIPAIWERWTCNSWRLYTRCVAVCMVNMVGMSMTCTASIRGTCACAGWHGVS